MCIRDSLNLLISHPSSDLCTGSRSTNALNINSFHLPTKFSQPANRTTYTILSLFSLQVEPAPHLLSPHKLDHLYLRHYKSPTAPLDMHHLTFGINSLLHSVNLIVFTLLLAHLILRISPHRSHHLRFHYLPLPQPFTPDLKLISFTNPFLHSHSYSFRTDLTDLNLYCIEGALALFVLVSFFRLRVLDKAYTQLSSPR